MKASATITRQSVRIDAGEVELAGELHLPEPEAGLVVFVHGSGSGRHSPRNQFVANVLRDAGLGTLLFDLLTEREELSERDTGHLRFGIDLLAGRLVQTIRWLSKAVNYKGPIGLFGASTGAAAALVAAAKLEDAVHAIVSRGGRPDLAGQALSHVNAPTLLIIGELDSIVIELNLQAFKKLHCEKEMKIVPDASHLFEKPGTLAQAAALATEWFQEHLSLK